MVEVSGLEELNQLLVGQRPIVPSKKSNPPAVEAAKPIETATSPASEDASEDEDVMAGEDVVTAEEASARVIDDEQEVSAILPPRDDLPPRGRHFLARIMKNAAVNGLRYVLVNLEFFNDNPAIIPVIEKTKSLLAEVSETLGRLDGAVTQDVAPSKVGEEDSTSEIEDDTSDDEAEGETDAEAESDDENDETAEEPKGD